MSDFKSPCGCELHVTQWTSKRKIAGVKSCPLHKNAKQLRDGLILLLKTWEEDSSYPISKKASEVARAELISRQDAIKECVQEVKKLLETTSK